MFKIIWSYFSPKQQLKCLCFMKILRNLFCTEDMSCCLVMNAINNACIDRKTKVDVPWLSLEWMFTSSPGFLS